MLRFSMSINGVSYIQELHSSDRLLEFTFKCGLEVISITSGNKDTSYTILGMEVAKVFEWGEKMSYYTAAKKIIYWGNSTDYNSTNIFND